MKILQKSKHPHPLIYLKGFQSKDFASILDFLYSGEANIHQEDLDSFLAIADEIQLKGLTGQTSIEDEEKTKFVEPINRNKNMSQKEKTHQQKTIPKETVSFHTSTVLAISKNQSRADLQALEEKVKAMMEKGQTMIQHGKYPNGMPRQEISYACKVCGKEDKLTNIRNHIETNHLEGISLPCEFCDKTFSARCYLNRHTNTFHA